MSSGATDFLERFGQELSQVFDENWTWAVARSVENNSEFYVCCYATHTSEGWKIDVQFGKPKEPCFGIKAAYMFVPMSEIFADVYRECRDEPDIMRSSKLK